ncbi:uncharacterized protein DUF1885 [Aneurinibacillus soli]|uniref:Uncharacterized protein n=1 Tax=Aneurinibacillus soli TaxID=1500254 RepID=A0A0U5AUM6_9BACL|nr:DUF1885 family protein [Aneurinibacillus soli]PYE63617.1 uncharacterized protein DUF1885 [Aneurinibacillus soli]BAU27450.1 hypothetical protein CB4_01624 [Aneurinibacillus soli]
MSRSAYITFVEGSTVAQASVDDVKQKLDQYTTILKKTGTQLDWAYGQFAFPYTIQEKPEGQGQWFYLKGIDETLYRYILIGVGTRTIEQTVTEADPDHEGQTRTRTVPKEQSYIQITLTEQSTHGDKGKANELCRYLASEYKAELHLFNNRVMYFNPRK